VLAILALVIAGAAVLSHTAPAPFLFEAFRPSKSLWRVAPVAGAPPTIYLTFDDGPNPAWTPALLDVLASEGVSATFFLIDEHITPETAPIVRRMADEGHAIGLHSGTRRLTIMPPAEFAARLSAAADRIASITGEQPCRLFRPHAGWRSASMYQGLDQIGYRLAGWSWGMWDWSWWQSPEAERTARRLVRKASPGDIVVIHDGHHKDPRPDRRHTPEVIRLMVPALAAEGFSFAPLCDMADPLTVLRP
jgi:peptidoglycan/xylan/chitin deacetylase (PgdA/CDA1 family)